MRSPKNCIQNGSFKDVLHRRGNVLYHGIMRVKGRPDPEARLNGLQNLIFAVPVFFEIAVFSEPCLQFRRGVSPARKSHQFSGHGTMRPRRGGEHFERQRIVIEQLGRKAQIRPVVFNQGNLFVFIYKNIKIVLLQVIK